MLDFACGTGTFLLEVFEKAFENIGGPESGKAEPLVREHFLKNIYGFEYLIAPYTIAHLKLSQYLRDKGHPLKDDERLQVFLTNTLEPIKPEKNFLLPAIAAEAEAAQKVKEKPILVITGNPPYSGHSKNKGAWISAAIDGYKYTIERNTKGLEERKPLGERNPKWLNDDYVKFIRFSQMKMDSVDEGIVAVITNHSWLDNPTFRGMRQSLMRSFEQIYVLDLHGNYKKKETAPDGTKDDNVFDIEQGVAISVFVKKRGLRRGVWRGDFWGKRLKKYEATSELKISDATKTLLKPSLPLLRFVMENEKLREEYYALISLRELFSTFSLGSLTKRDDLTVAMTKQELIEKVNFLQNPKVSDDEIVARFGVRHADNDGWVLRDARAHIISENFQPGCIKEINWRPFERRWIAYDDMLIARTNRRIMSNLVSRNNVALISVRQLANLPFFHAFVTDDLTDQHFISTRTKEGGVVFPLRVNEPTEENLSPSFRAFIDARYGHHYSPEEILGYIYAVLHAPTYRTKYAEFLRIDFPRIPFPEQATDFGALSKLGWGLVEAHLLKRLPRKGLGDFEGKGDRVVEKSRYSEVEEAVFINPNQSFRPMPKAVWEFRIGGYQVIDKYLKSRKGRTLTLDEINQVSAVADSLAFTIDQMGKIDAAYAAAFPDKAD